MIRDNDWYNANEQRSWPLDETSTLQADDYTRLPPDILVDLSLTFSSAVGRRASLSTLFVGSSAASLLIVSETGEPLAALTIPLQDFVAGRVYRLTSLHISASGWVTFGGGVNRVAESGRALRLRFTSPEQAKLTPRAARGVSAGRVTAWKHRGARTSLTGLIDLVVGGDLKVSLESLVLDGSARQALVFNLVNTTADPTRHVSSLYAGRCAERPESRTCPDPQPIEFINNVRPDCCGDIFLEFRGSVEVGVVTNATQGLVLDSAQGLADACVSGNRLPDSAGRLPNEYPDLCPDKTDTTVTAVVAVSRDAATGKITVLLDRPLVVGLSPTDSVTIYGVEPGVLDGTFAPAATTPAGSTTVVLDTPWTQDGAGGNITFSYAADPPEPDPSGTTPSLRTGLPWSYAFCTNWPVTGMAPWSIHRGMFTAMGGDFGYNGLGGNIGSITPEPDDASASVFALEVSHGLTAGLLFTVSGCEVAGYNTLHLVREVEPSSGYVVAETPWTADGFTGSWLALLSPFVNGGGSTAGGIVTITDDGAGFCLLTLSESHSLAVGDIIVVLRSSVGGYNTRHTITRSRVGASANTAATNIAYTAGASGGVYVIEKEGGGGQVTAITSGADGYPEVETTTAHGLNPGDNVVLFGTETGLGYDSLYSVVRSVSATKFLAAQAEGLGYTGDTTQNALWLLVGGYEAACLVWRSESTVRSVALWKPTAAGVTGWHSWNSAIETVLSLRTEASAGKFSGGLVVNHRTELVAGRETGEYWAIELAYQPASLLRIWKVTIASTAAGIPYETSVLLTTKELSFALAPEARYRLQVDVRSWNTAGGSAELTCHVVDLETAAVDTLTLVVDGFGAGTGSPGLFADQATTDFETFVVWEL